MKGRGDSTKRPQGRAHRGRVLTLRAPHFAPLRRLQSLQSIWQLAGTVRPFAVPRSDVIRLHLRKRP